MNTAIQPRGRPYSAREGFKVLYQGFRTFKFLREAQKRGVIGPQFKERIMLAVTEVNGCAMCSYGHAQRALEAGMGMPEIQAILSGSPDLAPADELAAILFAQHYAESRGAPSHKSWERVNALYGEQRALGILGAIRIIMVGNTFGIPLGNLKKRLCGQTPQTGTPGHEVRLLATGILFFPAAILYAVFLNLTGTPILSFNHQPELLKQWEVDL